MNLRNLFNRRASGPVARERLQILLSHERAACSNPDLLILLRKEILAVVARHVEVQQENVRITLDRNAQVSALEINIDIPITAPANVMAPIDTSKCPPEPCPTPG